MKLAAVFVLVLSLAFPVVAQLTPGATIRTGEPFPIIADFNGDGLDDLIQERNVILSDGTAPTRTHDLALPAGQKVMGVLDVNGDHLLDLLTVETGAQAPPSVDPTGSGRSPRYRLYIADSQRRYTNAIDVSDGPQPYVADVDADGKDDILLLANILSGVRDVATEITVLRSNGDGTFEHLTPFRIAVGAQITPDSPLMSGDLNHDGLPDLVIRCIHDLVVLRGLGGGRFAVEDRYMPMNMEWGWWSTRLADIDGDSNLDVVLVGFRSIRVLFGDGRGNFPRTTRATIAKIHDTQLPSSLPDVGIDRMNQPRNLAIGHFTRSDRNQIAAGMGEGDVVVFSYEQGSLREVARTPTEYLLLDIRPGSFRSGGATDLYIMGGLFWNFLPARVFQGTEGAAAATSAAAYPPGRIRAARPSAQPMSFWTHVEGECIDAASDLWTFSRDGAFGSAQSGETRVEAVFDGSVVYVRLNAPYSTEPVESTLTAADGTYSGTASALTSCGWKTVTITAKAE